MVSGVRLSTLPFELSSDLILVDVKTGARQKMRGGDQLLLYLISTF